MIIILGVSNSKTVKAEEPGISTLDPVIVTGQAHPTQPLHSTQSVSILERQQFETLQPNRLSTIFQQIPGIHIDEMGSRGGISSLYLRGADPNFTLVMLDGIPLNDSTNQRGGSVDLSLIPLNQIQRIEIVRGPLSSYYGSEAMGGAINLITRTQTTSGHLRLLGEVGRFDSIRASLQAGERFGPIMANLSLSHSENGAQVKKDRFSQGTVGWNLDWEGSSTWDLHLTGRFSDSAVQSFPEGSGGPRLALLRKTETRETQEFLTGLSASLETSSFWFHQFFLSVSTRRQDSENPGVLVSEDQFRLPPTSFRTEYSRWQARLTETWKIRSNWRFSLGGNLIHEDGIRNGTQDLTSFGGSSNHPVDFSLDRSQVGLFVDLTSTWWSELTTNTGLRLDLTEGFQPSLNPRFGLNYHVFPHFWVRGGIGTAYKLPSLSSLGDPLIGNPSLKPERSRGWDLGLHFASPDQRWKASVEYFHNTFRQLVDLDPELLDRGIIQLGNIDEAKTEGVEIFLSSAALPQTSFQASLTYLKTRVTGSGIPLRNRPKWRGSLAVILYLHPSLTLQTQWSLLSSRQDFQIPTQTARVDGYHKTDATLTITPWPGWHGYIAIENLTNETYEDFLGFSGPPLIFRFGLVFEWQRNHEKD